MKWLKWLALAFVAYLAYRIVRAHSGGNSWRTSFAVEVPILGRLVGPSPLAATSVHVG